MIVFFGANALVDGFGSSGVVRDAVTHERLVNESESTWFATQSFPGVPIYIAFEITLKDVFGAVFDDKSDGGATNRIAEAEDLSFHEFSFERFLTFGWEEEKTFDFKIEIGVGFFFTADFVVIGKDNA